MVSVKYENTGHIKPVTDNEIRRAVRRFLESVTMYLSMYRDCISNSLARHSKEDEYGAAYRVYCETYLSTAEKELKRYAPVVATGLKNVLAGFSVPVSVEVVDNVFSYDVVFTYSVIVRVKK